MFGRRRCCVGPVVSGGLPRGVECWTRARRMRSSCRVLAHPVARPQFLVASPAALAPLHVTR
eukprot:237106-Lingulodinium_polyedra.AAC.1